jgi:hypothetical protein
MLKDVCVARSKKPRELPAPAAAAAQHHWTSCGGGHGLLAYTSLLKTSSEIGAARKQPRVCSTSSRQRMLLNLANF